MNKEELKSLIREIMREQVSECPVKLVNLPCIKTSEEDQMHTGNPAHNVFTHDVLSLEESPRLGCGIMEMDRTTFPWTLNYDEIDYVISGTLNVCYGDKTITAKDGELIFIPKGSAIRFSVPDHARFLYVTYPADWQAQ